MWLDNPFDTKPEYPDDNNNGIPDAFENRKPISDLLDFEKPAPSEPAPGNTLDLTLIAPKEAVITASRYAIAQMPGNTCRSYVY